MSHRQPEMRGGSAGSQRRPSGGGAQVRAGAARPAQRAAMWAGCCATVRGVLNPGMTWHAPACGCLSIGTAFVFSSFQQAPPQPRPSSRPSSHPAPPAAALQQPAQGQNLAYLAGGNYLRELGIENSSEANRILDIAMNPNSMYALNNRKQVGPPCV